MKTETRSMRLALSRRHQVRRHSGVAYIFVGPQQQFAGAAHEKLLGYALGRNVEYFDGPTVRTSRGQPLSAITLVIIMRNR